MQGISSRRNLMTEVKFLRQVLQFQKQDLPGITRSASNPEKSRQVQPLMDGFLLQ